MYREGKVPLLNLDWGVEGVRYALKNHDLVVIVDTLRFSTAVTTAVANGFTIHPVEDRERGAMLAAALGAEMAGRPGQARYTISPRTFLDAGPGENRRVVLFSPNGAACAALVTDDDAGIVGCFLNAAAVGRFLSAAARGQGRNVTVVAAGEQRAVDTGERVVYDKKAAYPVFAVEDYLASGAIIHHADLEASAEAGLCRLAYEAARDRLEDLILDSFSGRYLVEHGLEEDILHALRHDLYDTVPVIRHGRITRS